MQRRVADKPSQSVLTRMERASLAITRFTNERPGLKRLQKPYHRYFTQQWVNMVIGRRVFVDNADKMLGLGPDRGVLLCSNHRSFFDMYITMLALFRMRCDWIERIYFPVRSNFFYETPIGLFMNYAIGGSTMYPPIFRDRSKSAFNDDALARIARFLGERGTVVGVHPEGTRNKTDDPYTLLPAQPGIGQMALQGKPIIVPMFINGVSNDFFADVKLAWQRDTHLTAPIIMTFGDPLEYSELTAKKPRLALYKRCADKINAAITELGQRERALRAQILARELDHDPRWFWPSHHNGHG